MHAFDRLPHAFAVQLLNDFFLIHKQQAAADAIQRKQISDETIKTIESVRHILHNGANQVSNAISQVLNQSNQGKG